LQTPPFEISNGGVCQYFAGRIVERESMYNIEAGIYTFEWIAIVGAKALAAVVTLGLTVLINVRYGVY